MWKGKTVIGKKSTQIGNTKQLIRLWNGVQWFRNREHWKCRNSEIKDGRLELSSYSAVHRSNHLMNLIVPLRNIFHGFLWSQNTGNSETRYRYRIRWEVTQSVDSLKSSSHSADAHPTSWWISFLQAQESLSSLNFPSLSCFMFQPNLVY